MKQQAHKRAPENGTRRDCDWLQYWRVTDAAHLRVKYEDCILAKHAKKHLEHFEHLKKKLKDF